MQEKAEQVLRISLAVFGLTCLITGLLSLIGQVDYSSIIRATSGSLLLLAALPKKTAGSRRLIPIILLFAILIIYGQFLWGIQLPVLLVALPTIVIASVLLSGTLFGTFLTVILGAGTYLNVLLINSGHIPDLSWQQVLPGPSDAVFISLFLTVPLFTTHLVTSKLRTTINQLEDSEQKLRRSQERVERELARRTEELTKEHAERTQSEERFAFIGHQTTAYLHDIHNQLTGLRLQADKYPSTLPALEALFALTEGVSKTLKAPESPAEHNLAELIVSQITLVSPIATRLHVRITPNLEPTIQTVPAAAFQQLIRNLLTNALDACAKQPIGSRTITITSTANTCVIEDSGPGIPEKLLDKVWEAGYSSKPPQEGMGLGLTLVQEAANRCGYTVTLENRAEGGLRAICTYA